MTFDVIHMTVCTQTYNWDSIGIHISKWTVVLKHPHPHFSLLVHTVSTVVEPKQVTMVSFSVRVSSLSWCLSVSRCLSDRVSFVVKVFFLQDVFLCQSVSFFVRVSFFRK